MTLKRIISASMAAAAVAAFSIAPAASALTEELNGLSQEQADASPIKPHIYVTSELITEEEAAESPSRTVQIVVEGAAGKYCSIGLHLRYDPRLLLDMFMIEDAVTHLNCEPPTIGNDGYIFFTAASGKNMGLDGAVYTLEVTLPDDAKAGDVFPFDIVYRSSDYVKDCFGNTDKKLGRILEAYTFTRGINNGETRSFDPVTDAIDQDGFLIENAVKACPAIADLDKAVDGFIAIASDPSVIPPSGDVNGDGHFTTADLVTMQKYLLGKGKVKSRENGDLCKDDRLDVFDLCRMRQKLVSSRR